uniref:FAR1 domain-containing protein n=1 Tax=Oryza glumipatula TaxID=40148 RepID=A0A0D9YA68_9ORYZ
MAHMIHQVERDFPPSSSSANGGTTPMHNATNLIDVQAPSSSGGFLDVLLSKSSGHETDLVVDVESVDNTDVAAVTVEIDEQLDEDASENDEEEKDVVCSPPIVPYIGMEFDTVVEARNVYNAYAYKLGFGTRIASSRNSQASSGGKKASKKCKVSENGDNHDDEPKLIRR